MNTTDTPYELDDAGHVAFLTIIATGNPVAVIVPDYGQIAVGRDSDGTPRGATVVMHPNDGIVTNPIAVDTTNDHWAVTIPTKPNPRTIRIPIALTPAPPTDNEGTQP